MGGEKQDDYAKFYEFVMSESLGGGKLSCLEDEFDSMP